MKNIAFRADGDSEIGLGHVFRSLALADMLKDYFNLSFHIQDPHQSVLKIIHKVISNVKILPKTTDINTETEILLSNEESQTLFVFDGYQFDLNYQEIVYRKNFRFAYIDDLVEKNFYANIIINQAEGVHPADYGFCRDTIYCLGSKYALLRKEFLNSVSYSRKIVSVKSIFLCMGGADPENLTIKVLFVLLSIQNIKTINILTSSLNKNLHDLIKTIYSTSIEINIYKDLQASDICELIKNSDVAICSSSTIAIECSSIGIGLICGITADNQLKNHQGFLQHNIICDVKDFRKITTSNLKEIIISYINDINKINSNIENQKIFIDGKSPERYIEVFNSI